MKLPLRRNYPTNAVVDLVLDRDEGRCVVCGKVLFGYRGREWSIHHRRPKGMGGTRRPDSNEPQNLISVCGGDNRSGCHGRIHSHPTEAELAGRLISKLSKVDPLWMPLLVGWHGQWVYLTADGLHQDDPPEGARS